MCRCSDDDYYTVSPYRPVNEIPHPSVSRRQPQRQPAPQARGSRREEIEKKQRQAQATAAARKYGWPTSRDTTVGISTNKLDVIGNRDSMIEPDLAGGLAAMPGSDFRAVYDPQRSRQPLYQQQQQQQPQHQAAHQISSPWRPRRPPYYQQRFIDQQPARTPPMTACSGRDARVTPQVVHQQPAIARKPVIQTATTYPPAATGQVRTRLPLPPSDRRRDSNGVSDCSDDDDDDNKERYKNLRNYTVSPLQESPVPSRHLLPYSRTGPAYRGHGTTF